MPTTMTDDQIRNMLVGAREGGINYWCHGINVEGSPPPLTPDEEKEWGDYPAYTTPVGESGFWLVYRDDEAKPYRLDRAAIDRGVQVMRDRYTRHWDDLHGENDDATTADVFVQCALFGEVIFG